MVSQVAVVERRASDLGTSGLQQALGWSTAEADGMTVSSSKSQTMVLNRKWVDCPLQERGGVVFASDIWSSCSLVEREMD